MARVRRASGVREHDLVARAKVLRESVDPLLPRLTGDAPREKFDRLRADLEEVRAARDDPKRLDRMSRWGDPLPRAYAGLLRYFLDPTTPTVVAFPLPGGEGSVRDPLALDPRGRGRRPTVRRPDPADARLRRLGPERPALLHDA